MARNPEIRILLISKTLDLASRFITTIREEIDSNCRLRYLYGELHPPKPRAWNRFALYLERERNIREPTLLAVPVLGSCTGLRADLIVADDIIDSEMCHFRSQRDRVHQWFLSELTPVLDAHGRMLVVGTRKHHDDLYSRLIANPAYAHRIDRAILDEARQVVLMPERWTYPRLVADREEIGTVLFNREKQNQILDEGSVLFRRDWLEDSLDPSWGIGQKPASGIPLVQGIDLAIVTDPHRALEKDTDFNAVITLALEKDGRLRLVDLWMERGLTPDKLLEALIRQGEKYHPARVVIEANAFQHWVERELRERSDLPVEGHITGSKNKGSLTEGVPSLAVLFERRKVILPAGDEPSRRLAGQLIDQFHGFGWEKHDDLVMAFWFAVLAARRVQERTSLAMRIGPVVQRF
jgi:hypothetical protein